MKYSEAEKACKVRNPWLLVFPCEEYSNKKEICQIKIASLMKVSHTIIRISLVMFLTIIKTGEEKTNVV